MLVHHHQQLAQVRDKTLAFVADYTSLRDRALAEWRAASIQHHSSDRLRHTIEQSFPPAVFPRLNVIR